jgi:acyl-CoA synthetase (AMP-forming)/AMP-acid ligase II
MGAFMNDPGWAGLVRPSDGRPARIFRGPEPDVTIPDVPLTPFLLEHVRGFEDRPAFIDGPSGRVLTYGEWSSAVRRTASGFHARGLRKGDVVAILSPNVPDYAVALHAVSLAGGIVTTMNPIYTAAELGHQLDDSGAAYLITVPEVLDKAREASAGRDIRDTFVFGEARGATPFVALTESREAPPEVSIDPRKDVVVLPYSSGTTGLPKGVMLTHHNVVANILQSAIALPLTDGEVMLGALPFFHIYGMVVIMSLGIYKGAAIVTMPRFDLEQCLALLQKHRVTYANIVPPIALALAKHPLVDEYDLSALKTLFSGAAPLGEDIARQCAQRLGCEVFQGYGLTETSPVTHAARVSSARAKLAGIGQPIPNTEAKVVDLATGDALGTDQEGEICIRGPQVMKGYLGRPDATADMIDAEGWLHTGDIGYVDEDGCFFVVDRLKELIKFKGLQIAPAELEAVLLAHPCVADAAVIPVADEEAGQIPKACVVLKGTASAEEIMAFVAERVAPYKKLRHLEFMDQIPKSASGKILRRVLVERERSRPAAS